jgi:FkbM family methyltransferase
MFNKGLHTTAKNTIGNYFEQKAFEKLNQPGPSFAGSILIDGSPFYFHHARAFYDTYKEIFIRKMYAFTTTNPNPFILDCGANMGVSMLFFAKQYPGATIHAFEPELPIFNILAKNKESFNLDNVHLHQTAVWHTKTQLEFFTDFGMGGSVANAYSNQKPTLIETEVLADYMQQKVDFLKMDIEGAEYEVLVHCKPFLKNVEHIFVEYHSYVNKEQHLEDLLQMLKEAGFRYHLSQSFSYERPFMDNVLACENMDMAINIFAYREQ